MNDQPAPPMQYAALLTEIKQRIRAAQAMLAVCYEYPSVNFEPRFVPQPVAQIEAAAAEFKNT